MSDANIDDVLGEVRGELERQHDKWGEQNHSDGTGLALFRENASFYKRLCDLSFSHGVGNWVHILLEEVYEALAESDPAKLRAELIQVAAVATQWVLAIDRRITGAEK